jgi:hypothetical protein
MKRRTFGLILLAAAGVVASFGAGTAYMLSLPQFGGELAGDRLVRARANPHFRAGEFVPRRFHPPPIALADLPAIDAVLNTHDHYDHLDTRTVAHLARGGTRFYVPLGIGAQLERWGGTFNLAFHAWDEPIRRTAAAARAGSVELVTPRVGEIVDADRDFVSSAWWEAVR